MNNYSKYPFHKLINNSCIICFSKDEYSWCYLTDSQKKYLVESNYLDRAEKIDVVLNTGEKYSMNREEFCDWVKNGVIKNNLIDHKNDSLNSICPMCGNKLVLRTAKKGKYAGQQFFGCSSYPECKYIKNI